MHRFGGTGGGGAVRSSEEPGQTRTRAPMLWVSPGLGGVGVGGADGGTTWKPCIQKREQGEWVTNGPRMEKVREREGCSGRRMLSSCTVLPNTDPDPRSGPRG